MNRYCLYLFAFGMSCCLFFAVALATHQADAQQAEVQRDYTKRSVQVTMRDGKEVVHDDLRTERSVA